MAWSAPITWVAGAIPTASLLNSQIRDNLLETMPAKATEEGQIFVPSGLNQIAARLPQASYVATSNTRSSDTYGDLADVGPTVTVTHGVYAIVLWSCRLQCNTVETPSYMSWALSGSNTRAAQDQVAIQQNGTPANSPWRIGNVDIMSDLTPGTTTWTAKYKSFGAGTSTFSDRFLAVIPL